MIIAIDFDGTIVEHQYPDIGPLKANAKDVINRLYDGGHTILIWTVRSDTNGALDAAREFLDANGIKYHKINQESDQIASDPFWTDYSPKIYADVYIDDRSLGGIPDDWEDIYRIIKKT